MSNRYIGRIVSIPGNDGYAFVGITTVEKEDGSPHELPTDEDIFLHQDDCAIAISVGTQIIFDPVPDRKRGNGYYRAIGATEYNEPALIPAGEHAVPGFYSGKTRDIHPAHEKMKEVPAEIVEKVIANLPMPGIPRRNDIPEDDQIKLEALREFMERFFPHLTPFGADFEATDFSDDALDVAIKEAISDYEDLGLTGEIGVLQEEVARFKSIRKMLAFMFSENLIRSDAIIDIKYLPDLFMAVPVWYHWIEKSERQKVLSLWEKDDPNPHECTLNFCELHKNQNWYDTFQIFNRRARTLEQYKGELIPPHVTRKMKKALEFFDYVVIATPYHDEAGKDWEDIQWIRAIDPYVLGFKKGFPFFCVLARFSDAGTFPLFNELVGDTINFLTQQREKLNGFNAVDNPFWLCLEGVEGFAGQHSSQTYFRGLGLGDYLIGRVDELIEAFEQGKLFVWNYGINSTNL